MKAKKIILFIVEGISDQTSLGYIMSQLIADDQVHFAVTGGDITTSPGTNSGNIAAKVGNVVRNFSGSTFKPKDFRAVVHLVDTDGAFIAPGHIVQGKNDDPLYTQTGIVTSRTDPIVRRNENKSANLNRLIALRKVWGSIPYSLYFFSCNLDHVLHNDANTAWRDKVKLANDFEDRYHEQPAQFIDLLKTSSFTVPGSYKETWHFIQGGDNSLKRYSNFHLFLEETMS